MRECFGSGDTAAWARFVFMEVACLSHVSCAPSGKDEGDRECRQTSSAMGSKRVGGSYACPSTHCVVLLHPAFVCLSDISHFGRQFKAYVSSSNDRCKLCVMHCRFVNKQSPPHFTSSVSESRSMCVQSYISFTHSAVSRLQAFHLSRLGDLQ
jgi:hypothetical protein